jgi:tripeptide aminopeptidase
VLRGFDAICLADGVQRNHEPTERISVQALETMFDVALTLVDEAAAQLSGAVTP